MFTILLTQTYGHAAIWQCTDGKVNFTKWWV